MTQNNTIFYSQQQKHIIGKLFKYYRKKSNTKWKDIEKAKISANQTYSDMEKGIVKLDDELYDQYIDFYHLTFKIKSNFETWFEDYLNRLYHVFVYFESDCFDSLYEELINEMEEYKEGVYYRENYNMILYCFRYYRDNGYMNEEEINDCLALIDLKLFDKRIVTMLLEVMYVSGINYIRSEKILVPIFKKISKYKNDPLLQYVISINEKHKMNFDSALSIAKANYKYWQKNGNDYRCAKCLMSCYLIYSNIDVDQAIALEDELSEFKNSGSIPLSLVTSINFNIAMFHYLHHDYDKAIVLYMENINNSSYSIEPLYICAILSRLEKELTDIVYLNASKLNSNFMNYYVLKKEGESDALLVKKIMKSILHVLIADEAYSNPYWRIFEEELALLVKKNKKYLKYYFEYVEIMKKTCKDL